MKLLPDNLLKKDTLTFATIEANAFERTLKDCRNDYSCESLINVYRDMLYIRAFEETLIKARAGLNGYKYNHPAHLSIGQEAVAVGQALAYDKDDITFGTHRSHGEFIATALNHIRLSTDDELLDVMRSYPVDTYSAIRTTLKGNVKDNAIDYLLYGAFAELFARKTGFQRGLGGSMHLHFLPFGIYPSNAIVGGSAPLAVGGALYNLINDKKGIVVANLGDGAISCGAVYEALCFSNMNQFRTLWEKGKGLPILFAVSDNLYARGSNTKLETSGTTNIAKLGAGVADNAMNAESVNGLNPLAVADAVKRKKAKILSGEGATLLTFTTYRHGEHSIGDNVGLRPSSEVDAWKALDPIVTYGNELVSEGIITLSDRQAIIDEVYARVEKAYNLAVDPTVSPKHSLKENPDFSSKYLFNNKAVKEEKTAYDLSSVCSLGTSYCDAIASAVSEAFGTNPTLIAYGEDVRGWNSKNAVYKDFEKVLPYSKLFNTSISESAIVGSAVGYAMRGGSAVTELLYADFMTRASDEIINQLAKWQSLSGGTINLPVTLRLPVGRSYGGQHSQDFSGIIARVNGLKVFYPVTPSDVYHTLKYALSSFDPCVVFEPKEFYDVQEIFEDSKSFKATSLKASGNHATVVTIGACLYDVYEAYKEVKSLGKAFDLFSLVGLNPLDLEPIIASVKKSGKLIIVNDAPTRGGYASDIASRLQKECFGILKSPIEIIGTDDSVIPPDATECGYYDFKTTLKNLL